MDVEQIIATERRRHFWRTIWSLASIVILFSGMAISQFAERGTLNVLVVLHAILSPRRRPYLEIPEGIDFNDEFVRELRLKAAQIGFIAVMVTLAGCYLWIVYHPDDAVMILPWILAGGVVVPAVAFAILHGRAGREIWIGQDKRTKRKSNVMAERRLGNRLKEIRTVKGLTQTDLAALVGVSRKTINTVENSIFVPSTILALALARTLSTSVEELFFLIDEESWHQTQSGTAGSANHPACAWLCYVLDRFIV